MKDLSMLIALGLGTPDALDDEALAVSLLGARSSRTNRSRSE
jgi:hypothetical protein